MADPPSSAPPARRNLALVSAALLAAVISVALWSRWPAVPAAPPPAPERPARRSLAVFSFRDQTPRPETAWIATALAEALSSDLGADGRLRVLSADTVARARADLGVPLAGDPSPEVLQRAGRRLAADLLVVGAYAVAPRPGAAVSLRLRVVDTSRAAAIASFEETGATVGDIVSRAADALRSALGLAARAPGGAAPAALPSDPEAARLWAEGLERLRVFDAAGARERLTTATEREPGAPLVHMALADAWAMLGYDSRAKEETRKAFAVSDRLPLPERLSIEARHREVIGDRAGAAQAWRALWRLYPDQLDYGLKAAAAETAAGRAQDAMGVLQALRRLPPPLSEDPRIDLEEASVASALSDYERSLSASQRAATRGRVQGASLLVARARLREAYALRALSRAQPAVEAALESRRLHEAAGDPFGAARAMLEIASIQRYEGDLAAARSTAEASLEVARRIEDRAGTARGVNRVASVIAEQGKLAEALQLYEETVALWRDVDDPSGQATAHNNVGETLWKQGQLAPARKRLEEALAAFRKNRSRRGQAFTLGNLGSVLIDGGDLPGAQAALQESATIARTIGERSLLAVARNGLARVQFEQGDLVAAGVGYQEALTLREELGERGRAAESRLGLSAVALEESRLTEAESQARQALEEFTREGAGPSQVLAQAALAQALVAGGRTADAQSLLAGAAAGAHVSEHRLARIAFAIAEARTAIAQGGGPDGLQQARRAAALAEDGGLVPAALEARLAMAQARMLAGAAAEGGALLHAVTARATTLGLGRLAEKAGRRDGGR